MLVILTMFLLMIVLIALAAGGVWWWMNRGSGLPFDVPFLSKSVNYATADYSKRKSLISSNEMKCMVELTRVAGKRARVFPKVRMNEIVRATKDFADNASIKAKLKSRHVDFLLCHPNTLEPMAAVNLEPEPERDGAGARLSNRDSRTDSFSEDVLRLAGVPILKLTIKDEYDASDIARRLKLVMAGNTTEQEMDLDEDDSQFVGGSSVSPLERIKGVASGIQDRIPKRKSA